MGIIAVAKGGTGPCSKPASPSINMKTIWSRCGVQTKKERKRRRVDPSSKIKPIVKESRGTVTTRARTLSPTTIIRRRSSPHLTETLNCIRSARMTIAQTMTNPDKRRNLLPRLQKGRCQRTPRSSRSEDRLRSLRVVLTRMKMSR